MIHHHDGSVLRLHVQPKAGRSELAGQFGDRLKVRIASPPVDGKANAEIIHFFSQLLDVPRSAIELLRGATGRQKDILIHGRPPTSLAARLRP